MRHLELESEGPSSFEEKWNQKKRETIKVLYGAKEAPKVESSIATKAEEAPLTPEESRLLSFYESAPSAALDQTILQSLPKHVQQQAPQRRQQYQANFKQEFNEIIQSIKSISGH